MIVNKLPRIHTSDAVSINSFMGRIANLRSLFFCFVQHFSSPRLTSLYPISGGSPAVNTHSSQPPTTLRRHRSLPSRPKALSVGRLLRRSYAPIFMCRCCSVSQKNGGSSTRRPASRSSPTSPKRLCPPSPTPRLRNGTTSAPTSCAVRPRWPTRTTRHRPRQLQSRNSKKPHTHIILDPAPVQRPTHLRQNRVA